MAGLISPTGARLQTKKFASRFSKSLVFISVDAHWWFSHFCCLEESHHLVLLDEVAVLIDTQMVSCQKSPVKKLVVIRLEIEP